MLIICMILLTDLRQKNLSFFIQSLKYILNKRTRNNDLPFSKLYIKLQ